MSLKESQRLCLLPVQLIVDEIKKLCFSGARIGGNSHSQFITNLGYLLQTHNYRVQHEYPISYMHRTLKTGIVQRRWGHIDLFADSWDHKIAIEYDDHRILKYKSIEKLLHSNADTLIGIVGNGLLDNNIERILEVMEGLGILDKKVLLIAIPKKASEEILW